MHIRRFALTAAALASTLAFAPQPADAGSPKEFRPADHLTVTVADSGKASSDGTFELYCHPTAGDHPRAKQACDGLDELVTWGKDPFASVGTGTRCTMQYGGPVSAHVRGTWAGRRVNSHFNRENGCEMKRWDTLVPLLPRVGIQSQQM